MGVLASYTDLRDFWEQNPQLRIHPLIQKIYNEDKSKGKQESSRLMYGLFFLEDLSEDNKFADYDEEDRKFLISEQIFGNKDFNWETPAIIELRQIIIDLCTTPLKRTLNNWRKKLEERNAFLASTPYSLENAEKLDKILASTDKLYAQYERLEKALAKEKTELHSRGNKELSLSDKGEI